MKRRTALLGLMAASTTGCYRMSWAQTGQRTPLVCFIGASERAPYEHLIAALLDGMRELGWEGGKNVRIEYRWGGGLPARYVEVADEVIAMKCDVIVTSGITLGRVVKSKTSTVPIVSPLWHDPVAEGFAKSLSRPGGNVTGTTTMNEVVLGKRLEFLLACLPKMKSIAILHDPKLPNIAHEVAAHREAAPKFGIQVAAVEMTKEADIAAAFAEISRQRHDAVLVAPYPLTVAKPGLIAAQGLKYRIPCIGEPEEFAIAGGFASYGADWTALYRQCAYHVDKILRGTKPGDLAIQAAKKFNLTINTKTAAALGISVPSNVLVRADRLIE